MICPNCQNDSIPFWKVWSTGGMGTFRCTKCEAISQVKKSIPLTFVSIVLGILAAAVLILSDSWVLFGLAFVMALGLDALVDFRFRRLVLVDSQKINNDESSKYLSTKNLAAATLLISALIPIGMWVILGLVGSSSSGSICGGFISFAEYAFSNENSDRLFFVWLAALPLVLIILSSSYFAGIAKQQTGAIALFVISLVLTVVCLAISQAVVIPLVFHLFYGFRCVLKARATQS